MNRNRHSFANAFFPRLSEWFAAFIMSGLGWMLTQNTELMTTTAVNAYKLMLSIADQDDWALCMIIFGSIRLSILLINGSWRRTPHLRGVTAFMSCFVWYQIAQTHYSVFGVTYIFAVGIFLLDAVNMIRALGDARIADHHYRREPRYGGQ